MRYVVKLGWSDTDRYEFQDGSSASAWSFAEMAATHRIDKSKTVEIEILPETQDLTEVQDESEVEPDEE